MCNKQSLSFWLADVMPEIAWFNGSVITEINIKFVLGAVVMRVKRTKANDAKEICFIESTNVRDCLRLLWVESNSGNSGVIWRQDRYAN